MTAPSSLRIADQAESEPYDPYDGPALEPDVEPEPEPSQEPRPDSEEEPDWDTSAKYDEPDDSDESESPGTPYRISRLPGLAIPDLPSGEVPLKSERISSDGPKSLTVGIHEIFVDPRDNVRSEYDPSKMEQLSESYEKRGQLQSILVMPLPRSYKDKAKLNEKYLLVAGFRRYFAAKKAKVKELIVIVKNFNSREDALSANLEENVNREEISYYDFLMRIKQLVEGGMSAEKISKKSGVPISMAESMTDLVENAAPELLEKFRFDESPGMLMRMQHMVRTVGKDLSKKHRFEKQIEWWKNEGWRNKYKHTGQFKKKTASAENMLELAEKIRAAKIIQDSRGRIIRLDETQAEAVADAICWCANPKNKKSPL